MYDHRKVTSVIALRKEQDGVFPAALTTADWETIEKVRAEAGSGLAQP